MKIIITLVLAIVISFFFIFIIKKWKKNLSFLHTSGQGERFALLNNGESTYFDFDENKLKDLFKDAKELAVDLFLLDDGWFGNKYPRNGDAAGLGDWKENKKKLKPSQNII